MASGFGAGTALYGPDWLSASTTIKILLKISSYYKRRQMENGDREKERVGKKKNQGTRIIFSFWKHSERQSWKSLSLVISFSRGVFFREKN